jgi:hypothetical protein
VKITKHSLAILVQKESTKCVRLEGVVQHCLGGKIKIVSSAGRMQHRNGL